MNNFTPSNMLRAAGHQPNNQPTTYVACLFIACITTHTHTLTQRHTLMYRVGQYYSRRRLSSSHHRTGTDRPNTFFFVVTIIGLALPCVQDFFMDEFVFGRMVGRAVISSSFFVSVFWGICFELFFFFSLFLFPWILWMLICNIFSFFLFFVGLLAMLLCLLCIYVCVCM